MTSRDDDAELWARYAATHDPALREAIILRYVPLVHFVLNRLGLSITMGPQYEDLVSQGLLGLIDAVDRYDPTYGTQFSTYATLRVRGQVLDQLRSLDWLSRSARRRVRRLQDAVTTLWGELQRAPTDEELAMHLHLELREVRQAQVESGRVVISLDSASDGEDGASLHELLADDGQADPEEMIAEEDLKKRLVAALKTLPEREQLVLSLYYYEELTMKEVGAVLDISESRVSQLHARAVMNLRALLTGAAPQTEPARAPRLHEQAVLSDRNPLAEGAPTPRSAGMSVRARPAAVYGYWR